MSKLWDPFAFVPRQVFTSYFSLLISAAFVVVSRVGCLGVSGVYTFKDLDGMDCSRGPDKTIS